MAKDAGRRIRVDGACAEHRPNRGGAAGERPDLTVAQVLAWAGAHHDATGRWPVEDSGALTEAPGETWGEIAAALAQGERGLPGGLSLDGLRVEHGDAPLSGSEAKQVADKIWAWEQERFRVKGPRLRLRSRGYRPPLTIDMILDWADAHHAETGRWPTVDSGRVRAAPHDDTWRAINSALSKGLRSLAGGTTLHRLLAERRNIKPLLNIEQILAWADAHHDAHGRWPIQTSGPVLDAYRETWGNIDDDLRDGRRGLPGGMTLARLLAEQRGVRNMHTIGPLSDAQILAWADAHHDAHGQWPSHESGPVDGAPGETWSAINGALMAGRRGLPGGTTLARLLVAQRGREALNGRPELTVAQILAWADAYHDAHGRWPVEDSGALAEVPEESWGAISQALARGGRGLPGGSSLARLLAEHRNARNPKALPRLSYEQVLAWADAHHDSHGRWPTAHSEAVPDAPGEDWRNIDLSLRKGNRGFPGGSSLARLLAEHRPTRRPRLTLERIHAWAEAYHQAHGRWPDACAGPVADAPGESWFAIDAALRLGRRGLPGGTSLRWLFGRSLNPAAQGVRPPLTLEQVLAWAEQFRAATGHWPKHSSGPIAGAPGEKWVNIDMALRSGRRGLPSGLSLAKLFARLPAP